MCNLGPNVLSDTSAGNSANAGLPQLGHSSRSRRHSRTSGTPARAACLPSRCNCFFARSRAI